jgi:hypothetical protein
MLQIKHSLVGENSAHGIRRLSTFVQPVKRLLAVELNGSRNGEGIVSTDLLNKLTIAWRPDIGDYDEVKWSFLRPMSLESDFDWHLK